MQPTVPFLSTIVLKDVIERVEDAKTLVEIEALCLWRRQKLRSKYEDQVFDYLKDLTRVMHEILLEDGHDLTDVLALVSRTTPDSFQIVARPNFVISVSTSTYAAYAGKYCSFSASVQVAPTLPERIKNVKRATWERISTHFEQSTERRIYDCSLALKVMWSKEKEEWGQVPQSIEKEAFAKILKGY